MFSSLALIRRNLAYYWRTNLAVVGGVAAAVAVLAGALLVGDSVRASLRGLFLQRLGRADHVVTSAGFFREGLADDLRRDEDFAASGFEGACPLVALGGAVTHEESRRRAGGVLVYGVDERFWKFHGREENATPPSAAPSASSPAAPSADAREVLLSEGLAAELGARPGDALLLRVEKPSDVHVESLHGRKEDVGRTVRVTTRAALPAKSMGDFSVRPQQSTVLAVFVPLRLLQKDLGREGEVNTILISARDDADTPESAPSPRTGKLGEILRRRFTLADVGVKLRALDGGRGIALESESALVGDSLAAAAGAAAVSLGMRAAPVLSYLANSIRAGGREVPYSVVTAVDDDTFTKFQVETATGPPAADAATPAPIILNEWAAKELGARAGDGVTLEYYLWEQGGRLVNRSAQFRLAGVVPLEGEAADRDLVPEYPGISGAESVADWDPPFPVDLSRIRPRDEAYWDEYRTTPKAFVRLADGQALWQSRFGKLTSLRVRPPPGAPEADALEAYRSSLRERLDPAGAGLAVYAVRAEGLGAARGATNFGEYFLYFSFFLVASALLLTALFFKLGVEQRLREIGVLQAVGFPAARVRRIFVGEGVVLALAGSAAGLVGAYAYGRLMMTGLRTWWVGAVGTTSLALHVAPASLVAGAAGGVLAALACVVWTLRGLSRKSTRSLLSGGALGGEQAGGDKTDGGLKAATRNVERGGAAAGEKTSRVRMARGLLSPLRVAVVFGLAGLTLLLAAAANLTGQAAGFFGGGTLLLVALLCLQSAWLRRRRRGVIGGSGWRTVSHLGARNATHRPGRSILCITLIASAAFIIVAVDAFRRDERGVSLDKKSGNGGYPLLAESLLPVVHDPNTAEGREALNLAAWAGEAGAVEGVRFAPFRVRPGDDASCLNLYQPREPRILAPTDDFLREGRFAFQDSLAGTPEERENPWLLLRREFADGAVPVVADANSMTYVLHLKLGDDFVLSRGGAEAVRMRLVGALADSVFQGELLMAEASFLRLFPEQEGFRFFLLDVPEPAQASAVGGSLEERLSDFGFDVASTAERLASFHRVENTFLSTFQMLGGLGLVLGTLGLAAVLLRNVLERRRELALLRAVGYNRTHFAVMSIAENALLLFCGLGTGTACALLAVAPVISARGGQLPVASVGVLLLAVVVSGLAASLLATVAALRLPLLPELRAE